MAGTPRAVKVSFNRPLDDPERDRDRYFGPDFYMVQWLEKMGYDVAYTDDVAAHSNGPELRQHAAIVIPAHSEYWSLEEFQNVKAARDAGVNIGSFSANTAYWKVRYEDGNRTLVCYKTVQGDGTGSSGRITPNDWGPDGLQGTSRRRARPRRPGRDLRRPSGELDDDVPRQRRAPRRPERARAGTRRARTCRRTSSSASCTSATTTAPELPA